MDGEITVSYSVRKTRGPFASNDELAQELVDAVAEANPDEIVVGLSGDSAYEVVEWDVSDSSAPGVVPGRRQHRRSAVNDDLVDAAARRLLMKHADACAAVFGARDSTEGAQALAFAILGDEAWRQE